MSTDNLRTVCYYTNWSIYARNYQPQDLPADQLTHVLYAFANIRPESGEVYLTDSWSDVEKHYPSDWNDTGTNIYGCLKQLYILKKQNRKLKVLLSIGGWTYSSGFCSGAGSPNNRTTFAKSAVKLIEDCGFDGIDIDWEYPQNQNEATSYVELLKTCRQHLDEHQTQQGNNSKLYLTVAAPCGPNNIANLNISGMDVYLDFWNLMAYDFAGSWDKTAGHQANIYRCDDDPQCTPFNLADAINLYKDGGVAANKLVIGMPLYGRAFCNTDGPGKAYNEVGQGSWENGCWDYKALPHAGAQEHVDKRVIASWSFDPAKRTMVTYDNKLVADMKAKYVLEQGLGGMMWWEASGDKTSGESLIRTVVDAFGGCNSDKLDTQPNVLSYPTSKYDNIRNGMEGA